MTDQGTIWLTQEAYDKLQAELDDLGPQAPGDHREDRCRA